MTISFGFVLDPILGNSVKIIFMPTLNGIHFQYLVIDISNYFISSQLLLYNRKPTTRFSVYSIMYQIKIMFLKTSKKSKCKRILLANSLIYIYVKYSKDWLKTLCKSHSA